MLTLKIGESHCSIGAGGTLPLAPVVHRLGGMLLELERSSNCSSSSVG